MGSRGTRQLTKAQHVATGRPRAAAAPDLHARSPPHPESRVRTLISAHIHPLPLAPESCEHKCIELVEILAATASPLSDKLPPATPSYPSGTSSLNRSYLLPRRMCRGKLWREDRAARNIDLPVYLSPPPSVSSLLSCGRRSQRRTCASTCSA